MLSWAVARIQKIYIEVTDHQMVTKNGGELTAIFPVGNGAEPDIDNIAPYVVEVTLQGNAPLLCHRWDSDAVDEKAKAAKGSKTKKSDNVESYVYRTDDGEIGIPGSYICGAIATAAKSQQDPRSPRKSALDLLKAGVISLTECASLGAKEWDYLDRRRVRVQQAAITRERPAFRPGWKLTYPLQVLLPEYISPTFLHQLVVDAGRFVGIADHRPTMGRFQVTHFEVLQEDED